MNSYKLRVIVLTHGLGEVAIQRLLEIESVQVAGIFVETSVTARRGFWEKVRRSIRYDGYVLTVWKPFRRLIGLNGSSDNDVAGTANGRDRLREIGDAHGVPVHFVSNYHTEEAMALMRNADADLGVVLGTNILKESVFMIPRLGSINLHQGLAPYYRGCPAVFWELFNDEREVGLTVHFVASKVDTGDIIVQRTVPLEYDFDSYGSNYERFISDYRQKLIIPCANLVAEAVTSIAEQTAAPRPQDPSLGKRYRLPVKKEKDEMCRRLRERRQSRSPYPIAEKVSSGD